jgi:hypothetical protein
MEKLNTRTLLADQGNIRIGGEFQATVAAVTNRSGREEALEELVWRPDSGLEDDKVDQFIISRIKHKFNKVTQHHLSIPHRFTVTCHELVYTRPSPGTPWRAGRPAPLRPRPCPAPCWRANMLDIQEYDMKKACTDLMVTFIDIKYGASAKKKLSSMIGESHHNPCKHVPHPRTSAGRKSSLSNVEGRGGDLASKDGRWLDQGKTAFHSLLHNMYYTA